MKKQKANQNSETDGPVNPNRRRRIAVVFSIFALSVGVTYTWYKKDPETGEKPKAEKEIVITKDQLDSVNNVTDTDTLFHYNH